MQEDVVLGDVDVAGDLLRLFDIVFGDLGLIFCQTPRAAAVHAFDVTAGHAEEDGADHHIAWLLGTHEGVIEDGLDLLEIHDLAFAHTARRGGADTEDLDGAVAFGFADDDADLARTDLESCVDSALCHGINERKWRLQVSRRQSWDPAIPGDWVARER